MAPGSPRPNGGAYLRVDAAPPSPSSVGGDSYSALAVAPAAHGAAVLTLSLPDASGRASAEFSPGPQVLYLGQDQTVADYLLQVPLQATLCSVRSFLAWDRGSIGEAGFDMTARGTRLAERSDHKETDRNYDGWKTHPARFDLVAGDEIHIQTRASQTGPRTNDGGRSTRVEFAWRLTLSLTGRCD